MKNDTSSKIVIRMKDIDDANRLVTALKRFAKEAGKGGDIRLVTFKSNIECNCGYIGHDVSIKRVEHIINKEVEENTRYDKALGLLREARAELKEESDSGARNRELSITITNVETSILWREEDIRINHTPPINLSLEEE